MTLHSLVLGMREHNMRMIKEIEKVGKIREVERMIKVRGVKEAIGDIRGIQR